MTAMREFWEGLMKKGITYDRHKNAVIKAMLTHFCDEEPVFDSEEESEEYYARSAEEILDLAEWDDEEIVAMHMINRDTTINQLIKRQNEKAVEMYHEIVMFPEEEWEGLLLAKWRKLQEERFEAHLRELGIDFETHKKAIITAEKYVYGFSMVEGFDDDMFQSEADYVLDLSCYDEKDLKEMFGGHDDDDLSFNDIIWSLESGARAYYAKLIKTPEKDWDKLKDSLGAPYCVIIPDSDGAGEADE